MHALPRNSPLINRRVWHSVSNPFLPNKHTHNTATKATTQTYNKKTPLPFVQERARAPEKDVYKVDNQFEVTFVGASMQTRRIHPMHTLLHTLLHTPAHPHWVHTYATYPRPPPPYPYTILYVVRAMPPANIPLTPPPKMPSSSHAPRWWLVLTVCVCVC